MRPQTSPSRSDRGIALIAVLLFLLLAGSATATLVYRSTSDGLIASNQDKRSQADSLARGGVQIALAALAQDRLDEENDEFRADARTDLWMQLGSIPMNVPDGGVLRLTVEDAGATLNLNALFLDGAVRDPTTEILLVTLFERILDSEPGPASGRDLPTDPEALAQNLIDWIDSDDVRLLGGFEDDYYQSQEPPYRAANRPLLSLDELALVEGFDAGWVTRLRPYLGVHPLVAGDGINPNTAPPWVLALLFHGTADDFRLAEKDAIRAILDIREGNGMLCADEADHEACTPIREAIPGEIYPPPTFTTDTFRVTSEARYDDVISTVEAMVDRADPTKPKLLSWSVN
jgi:general secretion pathway protein K